MKPFFICISGLVCLVTTATTATGDEIAGWRGNGTAVFERCEPPVEWSAESKNILWKTSLGKGYSSPVVVGDRVWVTASPSNILCLDAATGKERWRFSAGYAYILGNQKANEIAATYQKLDEERRAAGRAYEQLKKTEPNSPKLEILKTRRQAIDQRRKEFEKKYPRENRGGAGNAAATVLCDGQRVFAVFGTGVVIALTLDGKPIWSKRLEVPQQGFGHSSSPALVRGNLIVHIDNLTALHGESGEIVWQTRVPAKFGSPAVTFIQHRPIIVTPSGCIVDGQNGKVLAEKLFKLSHNSPLVHGSTIYAHESGKVKALELPDSLEPPFQVKKLWESTVTSDQRMATAIYLDGLLYAAGRKGVIEVTDATNGQLVYRQRSKLGEIFSSPVMSGGLIFLSGKDGKTMVFRPGRTFDQVSVNKLERITSLPTFQGTRMFLRTDKFLYCIGEK